jgi:endonuclease/exonuclease/phosphatase (EEP) superfamily protein YafD
MTFRGLLEAAAIVTVVFSFVTSLDFAHRNIELFCHFRAQYLAASLLLLIVFAIRRNPVYAVVLLVTSVFNASYVLPWYFGAAPAARDTVLKILHINVYSGNDEYERLLELIDNEDPDIFFLQEFSPAWLNATERLRDDYPFNYAEPRVDNFGIAMFSRVTLDSVTHVDSPPFDYPSIVATLTLNGKLLTIINTHPTIPLARDLYEARNEQLRSIAEIAREARGAVVLMGDFNTSVWSRHYQALEESTGFRNTRRGFGILPTWPTFMPLAMIAIDHVLVSDDVDVISTRTGKRIGSDHLPLIVELAVGEDLVDNSNRPTGTP